MIYIFYKFFLLQFTKLNDIDILKFKCDIQTKLKEQIF